MATEHDNPNWEAGYKAMQEAIEDWRAQLIHAIDVIKGFKYAETSDALAIYEQVLMAAETLRDTGQAALHQTPKDLYTKSDKPTK